MPVLKTYVAFDWRKDDWEGKLVTERNPRMEIPDDALGLYFFDRLEEIAAHQGKELVLRSEPFNVSGFYWRTGEFFSRDQVEASPHLATSWLNLKQTDCPGIIKVGRNYVFFNKTDQMIRV